MPTLTRTLHPELLVSDVMRQWPQTIQVFVNRHMACPGCAIAGFHTLAEIAADYHMDLDNLLGELQACLDKCGNAGELE